jgi:serine/threonine-protein kinase
MDGMVQVYVPTEDFLMGSLRGNDNELPQHTVYLDDYWIDKYEVTNEQYRQCVQASFCTLPGGGIYDYDNYPNFPVIYVDWDQAKSYCRWVDRRLPSEAEWEKAARGTDGRIYPWGNQAPDTSLANYYRFISFIDEVGSSPAGASPYGALDMAGNVWEWVNDWFSANYYGISPSRNPQGPSSGTNRVLRGGSWNYDSGYVRSAYRYWNKPDSQTNYFGFRCAAGTSP